MNEVAYRAPVVRDDAGLEHAEMQVSPPAVPLTEDAVQRIVAEVRRDLQQQIEWQMQRQLATRRGPALTEVILVLGSLATGAVVTAVLVANATTVVSGFLGSESATHLNTLPLIVMVWLALVGINVIWARRR